MHAIKQHYNFNEATLEPHAHDTSLLYVIVLPEQHLFRHRLRNSNSSDDSVQYPSNELRIDMTKARGGHHDPTSKSQSLQSHEELK